LAQDKTERPTQRRRDEARKRGQIARSAEIGTAGVLLAGVGALAVAGPSLLAGFTDLVRQGLIQAGDPSRAEAGELTSIATWGTRAFAHLTLPVALAALVAGLVLGAAQTRMRLSTGALKPSFKKLNPISGLKRILGPSGWFEGAKATAKTAVVGIVVFLAVWPELPRFGSLVGLQAGEILRVSAGLTLRVAFKAIAALVILAAVDVVWQWRRHDRSLRMTKEELKKELKQTDVSPEVRRQIRKRQYEMARRRMLADVPTADVVVTNPTHYAVALRYDGTVPAPQVVARGADLVAAAIRAVAEEHGVPILSNPPLARALYSDVEIGQQIPERFFQAVAEVLAFVYRTSGRRRRQRL
jgi:flagellar biosynthetic protein FlhB